jgi:hypothetical protein
VHYCTVVAEFVQLVTIYIYVQICMCVYMYVVILIHWASVLITVLIQLLSLLFWVFTYFIFHRFKS